MCRSVCRGSGAGRPADFSFWRGERQGERVGPDSPGQWTHNDGGARFCGGRCGGCPPAQGKPLAADRPKARREGKEVRREKDKPGRIAVQIGVG